MGSSKITNQKLDQKNLILVIHIMLQNYLSIIIYGTVFNETVHFYLFHNETICLTNFLFIYSYLFI